MRWVTFACLLAAFLAGSLLLRAAPASATSPGSRGDVLYTCGTSICRGDPFDPDATAPKTPVTGFYRTGRAARWSPDGTQFAFSGRKEGLSTYAIWVANADGSGLRKLTSPPYNQGNCTGFDDYPTWSPTGDSVAFARSQSCYDPITDTEKFESTIRVVGADAGGNGTVIATRPITLGYWNLDWSPDPDHPQLAVLMHIQGFPEKERPAIVSLDGSVRNLGGAHGLATTGETGGLPSRLSWSPDGKLLAYAARDSADVQIFDPTDGTTAYSLGLSGGAVPGGVAFTPDGARLLVQACDRPDGLCQLRKLLLPDPSLDFDPNEPAEETLTGPGPTFAGGQSLDIQPRRLPIIFIHGFAGSKIEGCGRTLWLPSLLHSGRDLLDMRLAADGSSPDPEACSAQPTEIVRRAFFVKDIYDSTLKFLEKIAPDDHYTYVWDWRKDPRAALAGLNALITEALGKPLQQKQGVEKVVIMSHSMGGLVTQLFLDNPAFAKRVGRVLTVGTPYWGAPKAIFPLAAGIESPDFAVLDLLLPNGPFQRFARNLTGDYFLYPSEHYGPWLTVEGRYPGFLTRAQLLDFVRSLHGNPALLARGLDAHHAEIDGFRTAGTEFRVVVGTGLATIGTVGLQPGAGDEADSGFVSWVNGDGTVPATSAIQGLIGTVDPLGDNVRITYACGVKHVELPGDPKVTEQFKDFLLYGTPPPRSRSACSFSGEEVKFTGIELHAGEPSAPHRIALAGASGPIPLANAAAAGLIQLLEFPGQPVALADDARPVDVTVRATNARLAVTPVSSGGHGPSAYYGPISGKLTLKTSTGGSVTVLDDGHAVRPKTQRQALASALKADAGLVVAKLRKLGLSRLVQVRSTTIRRLGFPVPGKLRARVVVGPTTPAGSGTGETLARGAIALPRAGTFALKLGFVGRTQTLLKPARAATLKLKLRFTPTTGRAMSFARSVQLHR